MCDAVSRCRNLPGSFECSPCPEGFTGSPLAALGGCADVDECALDPGRCARETGVPGSRCVNSAGSYLCGPALLAGSLRLEGSPAPGAYPLVLAGVRSLQRIELVLGVGQAEALNASAGEPGGFGQAMGGFGVCGRAGGWGP